VHYALFALPAKGDRFRGPHTYGASVKYFDSLEALFKTTQFAMPADVDEHQFLDGFVTIRRGLPSDAKHGHTPLYVIELPDCYDTNKRHVKV
jgi:hypothetical protein